MQYLAGLTSLGLLIYQVARNGLDAVGPILLGMALYGSIGAAAVWLGLRWARRHGRLD